MLRRPPVSTRTATLFPYTTLFLSDGVPVVFLHGGPGSGATPTHRRFFDPDHYRIVVFDQRGAGRSTPLGEIRENTTAHLVADIEALRRRLDRKSTRLNSSH